MHLLVHVEQYDVLGILPSQLESLAHLCNAMGIEKRAFIDHTQDGVIERAGFTRYPSFQAWLDDVDTPIYAFTTEGDDIRKVDWWAPDGWLAFGPAMGWQPHFGHYRVTIPGGMLNSRDAVPIALWEASSWQGQ